MMTGVALNPYFIPLSTDYYVCVDLQSLAQHVTGLHECELPLIPELVALPRAKLIVSATYHSQRD